MKLRVDATKSQRQIKNSPIQPYHFIFEETVGVQWKKKSMLKV